MKANKFFAVALAALTLVSFASCDKKDSDEKGGGGSSTSLALDPTSAQLEVGGTVTITATVEATWSSSNTAVATVAPGNDGGKTALVTALAEGSAVISATANGQTKTCVVAVKKKGGDDPQGKTIDAKRIWPIILDGVTAEKYASIIAADFRPNDQEKNLWVWDASYSGGQSTGTNFFGNTEGYLSLITATPTYGGAGFNLGDGSEALAAATALRKEIIANPDKFALHLAIKSTDAQNVSYYVMGCEGTYFTIGSSATSYSSNVIGDYARDGQWHEFNIELSAYATALSTVVDGKEGNIFCMLAAGPQGSVLNLDAVYFYEK